MAVPSGKSMEMSSVKMSSDISGAGALLDRCFEKDWMISMLLMMTMAFVQRLRTELRLVW